MTRVNAIWHHPLYQMNYKKIQKIEKDRVFCCHGMIHSLDVARLAYIRNLELDLGYKKELLYAAAILHDIGKAYQYEEKIPHEIAGEEIAAKILGTLPEDVAFSEEECKLILQAVRGGKTWSRLKNFFMTVTSGPEIVLLVRQKKNVTGAKRKRIGR